MAPAGPPEAPLPNAPAARVAASPPEANPDAQLTELGVDIIRVARIRQTLERFGPRFAERVLTPDEAGYVRGRAEQLAGRWAAKEAVSKVLGLGVRGVGWQEIEIVRLPTGQPAVRLHGRASGRARQLGMGRIAVSISHEREYAVAVATSARTSGGAYVFPPDMDERLDERERRLLARIERLQAMAQAGAGRDAPASSAPGRRTDSAGRGAAPSASTGERTDSAGRDAPVSAGPGERAISRRGGRSPSRTGPAGRTSGRPSSNE